MSCWACQAATLPNAMPLEPSPQTIGEAVYKAIPHPPASPLAHLRSQRPDSAKPSLSTSLQIPTKPAKPTESRIFVQHGYKGGRGGVDRAPDVHTRRWNQRPRPRSPDLGHAHSAAIRRTVPSAGDQVSEAAGARQDAGQPDCTGHCLVRPHVRFRPRAV
ncbi:hypothetical protein L1887_51539 [Cichorium endivia]|nr:hypothetical protein L1887_51539 [Cichorium endivia]